MKDESIAYKKDVLDRARNNLKENYGIYLTEEEIEELYDIQVNYVKTKLKEEEWCTFRMPKLGDAYYPQTYCNKKKNAHKNYAEESEYHRQQMEKWKNMSDKIEEEYQNNQPKKNRKRSYKLRHVITSFRKSASRRGFTMDDIEEIQNNIE